MEKNLKDTEVLEQLRNEMDLREGFVMALTHDLRTPLSAARMNAQMALRQGPDDALSKRLFKIVEYIDRADELITNILDANRIASGNPLPMSLQWCFLDEVLKEACDELSAVHGSRFSMEVEKVNGYWDRSSIKRIVVNLANNAIKYGSDGHKITIKGKQHSNHTIISVHNFGNPIPIDEQKDIFSPYKRSSHEASLKGWGIGLTLVKGLAEAHGGTVEVISSQKEGTTFSVHLPLNMTENTTN